MPWVERAQEYSTVRPLVFLSFGNARLIPARNRKTYRHTKKKRTVGLNRECWKRARVYESTTIRKPFLSSTQRRQVTIIWYAIHGERENKWLFYFGYSYRILVFRLRGANNLSHWRTVAICFYAIFSVCVFALYIHKYSVFEWKSVIWCVSVLFSAVIQCWVCMERQLCHL